MTIPPGVGELDCAIYHFICAYKVAHDGVSPTLREIMAACDIATTSVVFYHLSALEGKGLIRWTPKSARSITVTGSEGWRPPEWCEQCTSVHEREDWKWWAEEGCRRPT